MAPKRVLIVDDDPGIRKIVQISLKAIAAWEVLAAASGPDGLAIAQAESLDAILLDVMMPEMDGITTLRHLRELPTVQQIPIILLTAKVHPTERETFKELAIAGVIAKPFKGPELVKQMRSLLHWEN